MPMKWAKVWKWEDFSLVYSLTAATAIYSSGTAFLRVLGISIGWAAFQITMILEGNVAGLLTESGGRSKGEPGESNSAGVAVLFLAFLMIGAANYSGR